MLFRGCHVSCVDGTQISKNSKIIFSLNKETLNDYGFSFQADSETFDLHISAAAGAGRTGAATAGPVRTVV